jgi:hypothetical protein
MTMRFYFNAKKRGIMAVATGGFVLAGSAVVLAQQGVLAVQPYIAMLPGAVVFVLALAYGTYLAFWCPRCAGPWGMLVMRNGKGFFSIDPRIRFCPYCAYDIDSELDAPSDSRR